MNPSRKLPVTVLSGFLAAKLCASQIAWAAGFSIIIAWGGVLLS
jgi:hypothetical protein